MGAPTPAPSPTATTTSTKEEKEREREQRMGEALAHALMAWGQRPGHVQNAALLGELLLSHAGWVEWGVVDGCICIIFGYYT